MTKNYSKILKGAEVVTKFNPYHAKDGKFAPANGRGGGDSAGSGGTGGSHDGDVEGPHKGSLADYAKSKDDPNVTPDSILSKFSEAERKEIADKIKETNGLDGSDKLYTKEGPAETVYTAERMALHDKILASIFNVDDVKKATPAPGEKPSMVVLGGRGGSGKSSFTNGKIKEFDGDKHMVLDSDHIKGLLRPPYQGWNAAQVHQESSYILDRVQAMAMRRKLNVVIDGTLRSDSMIGTIKQFSAKGYDVQGHYMHLPRQEAAKRAVGRYLGREGKRGRLVPVDVVLGNKNNEANFDKMKPLFSKWSAYDNSGASPVLIQRSKKK